MELKADGTNIVAIVPFGCSSEIHFFLKGKERKTSTQRIRIGEKCWCGVVSMDFLCFVCKSLEEGKKEGGGKGERLIVSCLCFVRFPRAGVFSFFMFPLCELLVGDQGGGDGEDRMDTYVNSHRIIL